jgi:hypothetical protein
MIKLLAVGLSLVLWSGIASAQPTPTPTPTPAPAPAPDPNAPDAKNQKVDAGQTLESGGDTRPWAVGVPRDKQRTALKLFQDGNSQLNEGLFPAAVKLYRDALVYWDHPAIHYNLALALLNLDQPIEVYDSLQKAISFGPAPLEKEKFDHAQKYLRLVEQQIAFLEVTCKKPGAKVSVDGKEVFTVGPNGGGGFYKGRVKIGKHAFIAEKPGYNAEAEVPFIGPGETFRIELKLYTAEELTRYRRKWKTTWMPYAVVGGGVAFAILGGVLSVSAGSSYEEFDSEVTRCNTASMGLGCTDTSVMDLRDSGDTKKTLGYIGYGVAGAAVVTGLVMVYLNRSETYQITADQYKREERAKAPPVSITPVIGPDMSGAMLSGSF